MTRLKIVHYPHPALRYPAKPLVNIDKKIRVQIGKMFELMYEAKGLGLAATQVALPCQFLIMNMTGDAEQSESEKVFFNPVIVVRQGSVDDEEGCLSFPGLYAKVKRAKRVVVEAYDLNCQKVVIEAEDIEARAWQHEIEHLEGKLFIDRFSTLAKLSHQNEVRSFESKFRKSQEYGDIPPDVEIEKLLHSLERELTA